MTLYIAWLLLYRFEMEWWWYAGAILAYAGHICFRIYLARDELKEPAPKAEGSHEPFTIKTSREEEQKEKGSEP